MGAGRPATLKVIALFLLCIDVLAVGARIWARWAKLRRLRADDGLAVLSLLTLTGSTVAIVLAAEAGFGKPHMPQYAHFVRIELSLWATNFLYILTLGLIDLSAIILLRFLFTIPRQRQLSALLGVFVFLFTLVAVFMSAFQCRPHPWALSAGSCIDLAIFWRVYQAIAIAIDVLLVVLPVCFISRIRITLRKKTIITTCFSSRFFAAGASATQLAFASRFAAPRLDDFSYALWPWYMTAIVGQSVALICGCLPYLHELLQAVPSGMFTSDEIRRRGLTYADLMYGYQAEEVPAHRRGGGTKHTYILKDVSARNSSSSCVSSVSASSPARHSGSQSRGDAGEEVFSGAARTNGMGTTSTASMAPDRRIVVTRGAVERPERSLRRSISRGFGWLDGISVTRTLEISQERTSQVFRAAGGDANV